MVKVACGWRHTISVSSSGGLYTYGWSKYGQLGHGDFEDHLTPHKLEALQENLISEVLFYSYLNCVDFLHLFRLKIIWNINVLCGNSICEIPTFLFISSTFLATNCVVLKNVIKKNKKIQLWYISWSYRIVFLRI